MKMIWTLLIVAAVTASCSKSTTAPTAPTPTPAPPTTTTIPATFTLTGRVTNAATGAGVSSVSVAASGLNAGRTTTTASDGSYTLTTLTAGTFNVGFNAPFYLGVGQLVMLTGNQTLNQAITFIPPFVVSGVGDNVFTIPSTVTRIRIQASSATSCQNFVVQIAGRLIINVILGTCSVADARTHDGTYLTTGGTTQVTISSGISWTFTEVR